MNNNKLDMKLQTQKDKIDNRVFLDILLYLLTK